MSKWDWLVVIVGFSLLLLGIVLLNSDQMSQFIPFLYVPLEGEVVRVIDGDTFEMILNGSKTTVRYIGIDTPETVDPHRPAGCFGHQASVKNQEMLLHHQVTLKKDISDTDKFGRLLRYVYLLRPHEEPLFMNNYLVSEGYARVLSVPPDSLYQEQFLSSQQQAQQLKKGLWASC